MLAQGACYQSQEDIIAKHFIIKMLHTYQGNFVIYIRLKFKKGFLKFIV